MAAISSTKPTKGSFQRFAGSFPVGFEVKQLSFAPDAAAVAAQRAVLGDDLFAARHAQGLDYKQSDHPRAHDHDRSRF